MRLSFFPASLILKNHGYGVGVLTFVGAEDGTCAALSGGLLTEAVAGGVLRICGLQYQDETLGSLIFSLF